MKKLLQLFSIGLAFNVFAQGKVAPAKEAPDNKQILSDMNATKEMATGTTDEEARKKMILAQQKTKELFDIVEKRGLIVAGKSESELRAEIVKLAKDIFGTEEHWHKKIVRAGVNTLQPYRVDPPDRV